MRKFILSKISLAITIITFPVLLYASVWQIETVDSDGSVGTDNSLALDSIDGPHISYKDNTNGHLKYAYYNGIWHTETVDNNNFPGAGSSLSLDSNNNPHISYCANLAELMYASYDGTWHREKVEGSYLDEMYDPTTSLVLDSTNKPHISYSRILYVDLEYASYDGTWHLDVVDSVGEVGIHSSLTLDSSGNPHISYYDNTNHDLKYAHYDGTWHTETVDSAGNVGSSTYLALDSSGNPHISYYDNTNDDLKYAYYDGTWHTEIVDSDDNVGMSTSLALDSSGNPHISYYDYTNANLKYAHYDGTWHRETVDSTGDVGMYTSLALSSVGTPRISYFDNTNDDLKYAFLTCTDDFDCDEIPDSTDNCPNVPNPDQGDSDTDGVGNVCDNCPDDNNINQTDTDEDGIGDVCDNCPSLYNADQKDMDEDGIGDVCDDDLDGDGTLNGEDNCPTASNGGQEDSDGDGFGDVCDSENSFALIDWNDNKLAIFDLSYNLLQEKAFQDSGTCYFVSPSPTGWLVKGCPLSGCTASNWIIWDLKPDASTRNTITDLGPGPFYNGITSGNYIAGSVYSGIINLYDPNGAIITSTAVWEEEDGWPYDYSRLGDSAGLASGGFVIPPEGGYPDSGGEYTPSLYFYDNNLTLINKVDITSEAIHLYVLAGLSDGSFVATCGDLGSSHDVDYLCYFDSGGALTEKIDITGDIPGSRHYTTIFLSGLGGGGVLVSKYGSNKVWIYRSPAEEIDLNNSGINAIGSIAGNILVLDSDSDQIPNLNDNCPHTPNLDQEDTFPPLGNAIGDACDCEGNFDCDLDVDGLELTAFLTDFGRGGYSIPCSNGEPCSGDFICDGDVDGEDVTKFLEDFGRGQYNNPCPQCTGEAWCSY